MSGAAYAFPKAGLYNNALGSPLVELIRAARQSVDIEIYTMSSPSVLSALREAMGRGVRIRVVQEPAPVSGKCDIFAATPSTVQCGDLQVFVKEVLFVPGNAYVPFNKAALCGGPVEACSQHGKLLIADARAALMSTGNFDDSSLCDSSNLQSRCDRDYSVVIDDTKAVATLEDVFEHDLKGSTYDLAALLGAHGEIELTVSPLSLQPLLDFIASARTSVLIENQYLRDSSVNNALIALARAGKKVNVVVASPCAFGKPKAADVTRFSGVYSAFDDAGIVTTVFPAEAAIDGHPGYMHAKAIIVDGTRAWVGSVNGSSSALTINREFGMFFDQAGWVQPLRETMLADFLDPFAETWQESLRCLKDGQ